MSEEGGGCCTNKMYFSSSMKLLIRQEGCEGQNLEAFEAGRRVFQILKGLRDVCAIMSEVPLRIWTLFH